ncbi:MAG TPA: FAD-binding oxidoreductase [Candidatus Acidoferrales bacterium]|nr:FAD-binding oxidoreductase [Candidatus Acidoferrales bacterium]
MSMAAPGISSGLAEIVGPANVVTDPTQLAAYGIGACAPKIAVRPGTNQEVAEIVRLAVAEKLALVPVGARTKLCMNIPPRRYDLALDMTRLDRIVAYDPDDLTLSVEPGISLRKLADVLAEHGQFIPLAVPFLRNATVGGTIASGADSPLRHSYGTARDYTLGMEFVTGDGKIVKSGGRVVKNVSGYDLHKLMIGSLGSLGVLTKINLRTFPAPRELRGLVAYFDSAQSAVELRQSIAKSPLKPLTLEILSPLAAESLSCDRAEQIEPGQLRAYALASGRWTILASFCGAEEVLKRYERGLREVAGTADSVSLGKSAAAVALGRVREFIPIALESSPAAVVVKASVLPARIGELLGDAESIAAESGVRSAAIARGVGLIYFALLPESRQDENRSRAARAVSRLRDACIRRTGNFAIACCPAEWRGSLSKLQTSGAELELMRKLKSVFDPSGVFASNPLASDT